MLCTRISHHPEVLVYMLQLCMIVLINSGRTNYSVDKFHIKCQQFELAQVTEVYCEHKSY
jgi:hypothetical protein